MSFLISLRELEMSNSCLQIDRDMQRHRGIQPSYNYKSIELIVNKYRRIANIRQSLTNNRRRFIKNSKGLIYSSINQRLYLFTNLKAKLYFPII